MVTEVEQLRQRIQALELEQQQLQALLQDATAGMHLAQYTREMVLHIDPNNQHIVSATPAALDFLGYADLTGQPLTLLEQPATITAPQHYIESASEIQWYRAHYRHAQGHFLAVRVQKRHTHAAGQAATMIVLQDDSLRGRFWRELSRREDTNFYFREKLKILNEINLELGKLTTLEALCRRSIELGLQRLGFDRLSIWLFNPAERVMEGTFGTDEQGTVRDERGQRWQFHDTYVEDFLNGQHEPRIDLSGAPHHNERSQIVGYGWHLTIPLLDGEHFIGYLAADNHVRQQDLQNYEVELLRLYGASIGHLIARQREQETIRKLSNALQQSASMVMILDQQRRIEFVNPSFCTKSGYAATAVIGRDIADFFPTDVIQTMWAALAQGKDWHGELQHQRQDGTPYMALVLASVIRTSTETEHYVIVQEDITALHEARQNALALQLEQARGQMLRRFVNDIGHEFKTPLTIINTRSYLLSRFLQDNEPLRQHSENITEQVAILNHLMDETLEIVKLGSNPKLTLETTPLLPCVEKALADFVGQIAAKQLTLSIAVPDAFTVRVDRKQLIRALQEIVQNAAQYTTEGGNIHIEAHDYLTQVGISIQDTGIGIAEADHEQIFEHFYRVDQARSVRGSGLGLTIAKFIVEAHHGKITVHSALGHGSRFEIIIPK